jgi:hypothetical protein
MAVLPEFSGLSGKKQKNAENVSKKVDRYTIQWDTGLCTMYELTK